MLLWDRLRRTPGPERRLLAEAASLLLVTGAALRVCPFPWLRKGLALYTRLRAGRLPADRVAWAVSAAARRLPGWFSGCLPQALAAETLLARHGYRPQLRIGVRPSGRAPEARRSRLEAHAWVELRGAVLVGALDDLSTFVPLERPGAGASLCRRHAR